MYLLICLTVSGKRVIDIWPQTLNLQQEAHSFQHENSIIPGEALSIQNYAFPLPVLVPETSLALMRRESSPNDASFIKQPSGGRLDLLLHKGRSRSEVRGRAVGVFWVTLGNPPLHKQFSENLQRTKMFQGIGSLTEDQPRSENVDWS